MKTKLKSLSHVRFFVTPWTKQSMEFSCQKTGVGSCSLLQGIFPIQGQNPGLPHCRQVFYQLSHKGSFMNTKDKEKVLKQEERSNTLTLGEDQFE